MKAYVIKNKDGKYWQWTYNNESEFLGEIYNAFMEYSKTRAEKDIVSWQLKDCNVVEITICEGDLEEENRVLKKALKLACETIHSMMPDKPLWICGDALAKKYNIPNTPTIKDYDYFIQQAKENEKDE